MLSGIGRPDELAQLGIDPVAESPGVGLNLSDHPACGAVYLASREDSLFGAMNPDNLASLATGGRGPLTSSIAEAGGFWRTRGGLGAPESSSTASRPSSSRRGSFRATRTVLPSPRTSPSRSAAAGSCSCRRTRPPSR
jgi:choline dehydrogenase-like flavoprotein